jgi:L-seryl-tRNA(Ser) seleniumtransferase
MNQKSFLQQIPSVDKVLGAPEFTTLIENHGTERVKAEVRADLDTLRAEIRAQIRPKDRDVIPSFAALADALSTRIRNEDIGSFKKVINLTGTVLHTNLGRASLPTSALDAVVRLSAGNSNLEFDLNTGKRGDRDSHVEALVQTLTGAEAVTVVNNNAAAVLICLNTLAFGQEVCISRGELVEIGGSFRIPEVMEKSGCTLKEIGATNRTHLKDYQNAIGENTGLLMKVHTSNYEIRGFTQEVDYDELASLGKQHNIPLLADLGSGTLVNLEDYGLAHEPTVQEILNAGADVVTFSGDKLLGGPQAGIIAGKKEFIDRIKENPLKRALRVDKMTLAALTEVLKLYREPETLGLELPTLRHLGKTADTVLQDCEILLPAMRAALKDHAEVSITPTESQIGSGALPLDQIASFALAIKPNDKSDHALQHISDAFRSLPSPVIGRLQQGKVLFDLRTLDDASLLTEQLQHLNL